MEPTLKESQSQNLTIDVRLIALAERRDFQRSGRDRMAQRTNNCEDAHGRTCSGSRCVLKEEASG